MKMKKTAIALILMSIISGCLEIPEPVVSQFNGNTVSIQGAGLAPVSAPGSDDITLAEATCGGAVRYASGSVVADGLVERLFICI